MVAGLLVAATLAGCGALPDSRAEPRAPLIDLDAGRVRGIEADGVARFRGIPYAAPPVGERRWHPPQPPNTWRGIREATTSGPVCLQPEAPEMPPGLDQSEDCLTLDVTAPAGDSAKAARPVLVWIPGGGFVTGAGSIYDPARLVRAGGVVVVTVNYRLGVFGFYAHPGLRGSNFGLQDQVAALAWVRDNIAHFGGDPGRVTLAGASAGAMSACTLLTSPQARGLFQQAIVASGSCRTSHPAGAFGEAVGAISTWQPLTTIQHTGRGLASRLGCSDVACLRDLPARALLPHTAGFPLLAYGTELVPEEPARAFDSGKQAEVPLLQGNTADEHLEFTLAAYPEPLTADRYSAVLRTAFGQAAADVERRYPATDFPSPTAAAGRVFSDRDWICPSWRTGRQHSTKAPTYAYIFAAESAPTPAGNPLPPHVRPATAHGSDLYYLFDFPTGPALTAEQQPLADLLVGYWTAFVRSADPNGADRPHWPRFDEQNTAIRFQDGAGQVDMNAGHHCELWGL
ncbi:carboxylesterase/lipase family protein [Nocardia carnea]|uniref:carboxylesterase/lipase family protein n=1 Tax=Nocardia carnea TaxID=37328 RepID=UPI002455F260|nr:carboxylesterase family protein [Nocardia carnea]